MRKKNPILPTTMIAPMIKKNIGPELSRMIKAPMKLPIIYEDMYQTQKYPKKKPSVSAVAQHDIYSPCATHRIACPNPARIDPAKQIVMQTLS